MFIAARDRYGVKPLFWTIQDKRLLVASEAKAFLPFGWKPEWDRKVRENWACTNEVCTRVPMNVGGGR